MLKHIKRDFLEASVLNRVGNIPLHARQPMIGNISGRHRSPTRGSSMEFAEYRKYVPGDDPRRLDWRAFARSDRYYIKEFEADTNLRMCLVVDTSGSMGVKYEDISKLHYARQLAGTLAYLAIGQGDAVGLYCAGAKFHKEIPPRRNAAHLGVILDELTSVRSGGDTGLIESLHEAAEKIPMRALIVVVSDLFVQPEELKSCFQHLIFRKHDVAVFHLLEQNELDFDFRRPTRFIDLEGGASVMTDPSVIRARYHEVLEEYESTLQTAVRDSAVDYHRISIQEPYDRPLARFLLGRVPKKGSA